jgi:serine/threonine protein kinase
MKTCPSCQKTNEDQAAFCIECGGHLPVDATEADAAGGSTVPAAAQGGSIEGAAGAGGPGALEPGTIVDRKYEVERVLGEGGMGIVYVAKDIHTQVRVVVKAIRAEYTHRPEFRERILAEGRALARIDHVNVVRLNAVVVEGDSLFLVMQYIEGESLDKVIERHAAARTPMPLLEAIRIFRQVLEGVGAAHREGVIHRDIKPANILIRARDGVAKVTDFGIAKAEEDAKAGRGQTRGIIGSLLYMAPEQVTGRRDLDKRVDIYALGILLFEMLVGRVPFDAPSEFEIMKLHVEAAIPPVSAMRPDVPPFLDAVIARACAKQREQRFASAEEFLHALDAGMAAALATAAQPVVRMTSAMPPAPPSMVAVPTEPAGQGLPATVTAEPVPLGDPSHRSTTPGIEGPLVGAPAPSRFGLWARVVLAVVVMGAGAALGTAYATGWIHLPGPLATGTASRTANPADAAVADGAPEAEAKSILAQLEGAWRSDSGRVYDAKLAGRVLEFRIRDAAGLRELGYVDGEARFLLTELPGEPNMFQVEDKWRPALPADLRYDPARARSTCQQVFTSVDGRPLRGQYDGRRLTLDAAKVDPDRQMFITQGSVVVGCTSLRASKLERIQSVLKRE